MLDRSQGVHQDSSVGGRSNSSGYKSAHTPVKLEVQSKQTSGTVASSVGGIGRTKDVAAEGNGAKSGTGCTRCLKAGHMIKDCTEYLFCIY